MLPSEPSNPHAHQSETESKAATSALVTVSEQTDSITTATRAGLMPMMPAVVTIPHERPRLPPIMSIDEYHRGFQHPVLLSPGTSTTSYNNSVQNVSPLSTTSVYKMSDPLGGRHRREDAFHPVRSPYESTTSPRQRHSPSLGLEASGVPSKRPYGAISEWPERGSPTYLGHIDSTSHLEAGTQPYRSIYSSLPPSSRSSLSEHMTTTRTHSLTATNITEYSPVLAPGSNTHRCSLYIRQQPRAARAGPDGKDRRAIDPPPVLQLMIDNFDPTSENDMSELRSSYFVVHCRLVSAQSPKRDMSTLASTNDDGSTEIQRLLLGTSVASPFFCADDPDLGTMPLHPRTDRSDSEQAPPSPTSRFIVPRTSQTATTPTPMPKRPANLPGMFFIFADLSIRRAGEYRLEFCLMKVEPSTMVAGSKLPILHSVTSQVFRVVNAKDFDQVQPSTDLVKGLLDRGAGFPLKLKKGTREGGRRKTATDSEGGGGSVGGGDGDEEDDDEEDD